MGNGVGDTVTAYIPMEKQTLTTAQFDWGYLEIIDEMGIIGLIIWIIFLGWILKNGPLAASVIALLVINITSPALFHVMGIIWFVFLLAHASLKQSPLPVHTVQLS